MKKIAICGVHGVGKSQVCKNVFNRIHCNKIPDININFPLKILQEQYREIIKNLIPINSNKLIQTEEITLATYAKQLYLENLYAAQGNNILCDRSVLDTFVYYEYFSEIDIASEATFDLCEIPYNDNQLSLCFMNALNCIKKSYSKIYLIEPSDRAIENDGYRMTNKKQQLEIHQLFLQYFKDFLNVEIINQEIIFKNDFIDKIINDFILDN